jgi:O-acetyl-ADP-ribose deacetylase (regulator of RNase III)
MVREIKGDLLKCDANVLCHQTNYYGVMGGGIALSIKNKVLTPMQYSAYQNYCYMRGEAALGTVQYLCIEQHKRVIANLFSQYDMGTDYEMLRKCLYDVKNYAAEHGYTVAVPGYIGCGIAGGDWSTVHDIIFEVFNDAVELTIVYWDKEV